MSRSPLAAPSIIRKPLDDGEEGRLAALASASSPLSVTGIASVYSRSFDGKLMASGVPFSSSSSYAASLIIPIGSFATVTNHETGKSALIHIMDRGPHHRGRVADLSCQTADEIGMGYGLAMVTVTRLQT